MICLSQILIEIMRLLTKNISRLFSYALRSPINSDLLKTETGRELLSKSTAARFKDPKLVSQLHEQHELYRQHLYQFENLSRQANDIKKQIKDMMKGGKQADASELKTTLANWKVTLTAQEEQLKKSKSSTEQLLAIIGNQVSSETIISKDQNNNKVLRYYHPSMATPLQTTISTDHQAIVKETYAGNAGPSYQQLNEMFGISDLTRGQKVSGHRGYFLCTNGVKLALGLAQYGLDFLQQRGYQLYQTPALILEEVLKDSCQLQSIQTDMYRFQEDGLCLIATSEQTLAGYYRGETIQSSKLPLRLAGYSSCFRREAGAHGKDIHGLFRLHQFEKVEQFSLVKPQLSTAEMARMLQTSQDFYKSLGLPYRIVDIVSGELNDPAIRKIDLQAWYPSQQKFRQLVSISNCTEYQSRLLETKFRDGPSTKYVHMLNGTLIAIQRAITCCLQHFYDKTSDSLKIPPALQPYLRTSVLHKPT